MSLADIAAADLQNILNAAGCAITLQAPDGQTAELTGLSQDIAHAVDPETGQLISGRTCSVVLSLYDLLSVNMAPKGEPDGSKKPWLVKYVETVSRCEHTFKVRESKPDRTIGGLVLILEFYKSQP